MQWNLESVKPFLVENNAKFYADRTISFPITWQSAGHPAAFS